MASTINATSTGSGGLISTGDASGQLELQADGSTKLTVSSSGVSISGGIASPLTVTGNSTAGAELRLPEDTDNGSNYVALKAANSIASNVTFTLPSVDGTSGQVLQTNGSGTLSFATPASGALVYISTQTASNSATINFTGISSTYDVYAIQIVKALPATDGAVLRMRTSTNNGSSYDAGASDYDYIQSIGILSSGSYASGNTGSTDSFIRISYSLGNASNELGFNGWIYLWKPSDATYFSVGYSGNGVDDSGQIFVVDQGLGRRLSAADVDAVRFLMSSGNITSGTFRLYGVANS
jgi:hypothetical protein